MTFAYQALQCHVTNVTMLLEQWLTICNIQPLCSQTGDVYAYAEWSLEMWRGQNVTTYYQSINKLPGRLSRYTTVFSVRNLQFTVIR